MISLHIFEDNSIVYLWVSNCSSLSLSFFFVAHSLFPLFVRCLFFLCLSLSLFFSHSLSLSLPLWFPLSFYVIFFCSGKSVSWFGRVWRCLFCWVLCPKQVHLDSGKKQFWWFQGTPNFGKQPPDGDHSMRVPRYDTEVSVTGSWGLYLAGVVFKCRLVVHWPLNYISIISGSCPSSKPTL